MDNLGLIVLLDVHLEGGLWLVDCHQLLTFGWKRLERPCHRCFRLSSIAVLRQFITKSRGVLREHLLICFLILGNSDFCFSLFHENLGQTLLVDFLLFQVDQISAIKLNLLHLGGIVVNTAFLCLLIGLGGRLLVYLSRCWIYRAVLKAALWIEMCIASICRNGEWSAVDRVGAATGGGSFLCFMLKAAELLRSVQVLVWLAAARNVRRDQHDLIRLQARVQVSTCQLVGAPLVPGARLFKVCSGFLFRGRLGLTDKAWVLEGNCVELVRWRLPGEHVVGRASEQSFNILVHLGFLLTLLNEWL